jgi:hypothetical protein
MWLVVSNKTLRRTHSVDLNSDDWRFKLLADSKFPLSEAQMRVLAEGPSSLSEAWILQALKYKYHIGKLVDR